MPVLSPVIPVPAPTGPVNRRTNKGKVNRMDNLETQREREDYTWLIAVGVMYLSVLVILFGPRGTVFNAVRGLLTGLALCSALVYLVLTYLPGKYR